MPLPRREHHRRPGGGLRDGNRILRQPPAGGRSMSMMRSVALLLSVAGGGRPPVAGAGLRVGDSQGRTSRGARDRPTRWPGCESYKAWTPRRSADGNGFCSVLGKFGRRVLGLIHATATLRPSRNLTVGERRRGSPWRCGSPPSVRARVASSACRTRRAEKVASLSPKTWRSRVRTTSILRGGREKPDTEFAAYSCGISQFGPGVFQRSVGWGARCGDVLG